MNATAHYALLAAIVAGALGALIVYVLACAYGFRVDDSQPAALRRRRRITRLGHGLAGVSFALAAIAVVVGLLASSRASAHAEGRFRTLHMRVNDLVSTLHSIGEAAERLQARWSAVVLTGGREEPAADAPRPSADEASTPELPAAPERAPALGQTADTLPAPGSAVAPSAPPRSVPSLPPTPRAAVFPPRITQPSGRPLPGGAMTGASGAVPRPPEPRPVVRFERVERLRPPTERPAGPVEMTDAPSTPAPAPRLPSVVDGPKVPDLEIVPPSPPPVARPRGLETALPRPPKPDEGPGRLGPPASVDRSEWDGRDRSEKKERAQPMERPERRQRRDDAGRAGHRRRLEHEDRREKPERVERLERSDQANRPDKMERAEKAERADEPERIERIDRAERRERIERSEDTGRPERHERIERPTRRDD